MIQNTELVTCNRHQVWGITGFIGLWIIVIASATKWNDYCTYMKWSETTSFLLCTVYTVVKHVSYVRLWWISKTMRDYLHAVLYCRVAPVHHLCLLSVFCKFNSVHLLSIIKFCEHLTFDDLILFPVRNITNYVCLCQCLLKVMASPNEKFFNQSLHLIAQLTYYNHCWLTYES